MARENKRVISIYVSEEMDELLGTEKNISKKVNEILQAYYKKEIMTPREEILQRLRAIEAREDAISNKYIMDPSIIDHSSIIKELTKGISKYLDKI